VRALDVREIQALACPDVLIAIRHACSTSSLLGKIRRNGERTHHRRAKRPARDRCTHGCGGPEKGPWFCNKYRLRLAYANSFGAVRPLPRPRPHPKKPYCDNSSVTPAKP